MNNTQETKPKNPDKQEISGRDEKGRFVEGQSGNPEGRPTFSITGLVRAELLKCPEGKDKKTYADLIVKRILAKAIKDGDTRMIERIWAYMDGLPKQILDVQGNLQVKGFDYDFNNSNNQTHGQTTRGVEETQE